MVNEEKFTRSNRSDHSLDGTLSEARRRNLEMGDTGQWVDPFIFIKIPRTASESMSFVFKENVLDYIRIGRMTRIAEFNKARMRGLNEYDLNDFSVCYNHMPINRIRAEGHCPDDFFNDRFSFCFVRNPWDRLTSVWHLFNNTGQKHQIKDCKTFKQFVRKCHKSWNLGDVDSNSSRYRIPDPQWRWTAPDLTFIGRFENLKSDWEKVCSRIGFSHDLDKHSKMHLVKIKPSLGKMYDPESIEIVEEMYADDIELFGYSVDRTFCGGDTSSDLSLKRIKKNLKKHWSKLS